MTSLPSIAELMVGILNSSPGRSCEKNVNKLVGAFEANLPRASSSISSLPAVDSRTSSLSSLPSSKEPSSVTGSYTLGSSKSSLISVTNSPEKLGSNVHAIDSNLLSHQTYACFVNGSLQRPGLPNRYISSETNIHGDTARMAQSFGRDQISTDNLGQYVSREPGFELRFPPLRYSLSEADQFNSDTGMHTSPHTPHAYLLDPYQRPRPSSVSHFPSVGYSSRVGSIVMPPSYFPHENATAFPFGLGLRPNLQETIQYNRVQTNFERPAFGNIPVGFTLQPLMNTMGHQERPAAVAPALQLQRQDDPKIPKRRVIKRRTRTGCLTCRKRRIKCDEAKPHCLNCQRSRKLCLGYEAIPKNRLLAEQEPVSQEA